MSCKKQQKQHRAHRNIMRHPSCMHPRAHATATVLLLLTVYTAPQTVPYQDELHGVQGCAAAAAAADAKAAVAQLLV